MSGFAVAVCGFPRSGSSMLMRMLDEGGRPPVAGSADVSYELIGGIEAMTGRPTSDFIDRAVKILDFAVWADRLPPLPSCRWKFIWSDRDATEQAKSTVKLMRGIGVDVPKSAWRDFAASYPADRTKALAWLRDHGDVLTLSYESIIANPATQALRIHGFIPGLNAGRMANVVTRRSPRCAPDLAFEMGRAS